MKVRNLKKHIERFNKVVSGLKEGKQEMAKQVQELATSIDALLAKIKVSHLSVCEQAWQTSTLPYYPEITALVRCSWDSFQLLWAWYRVGNRNIWLFFLNVFILSRSGLTASSMTASDLQYLALTPVASRQNQSPVVHFALCWTFCAVSHPLSQNQYFQSPQDRKKSYVKRKSSPLQ